MTPDPIPNGSGSGSWLALAKLLAGNPAIWPIPLVGFLVLQQSLLLWSLLEKLDRLTVAINALAGRLP